MSDAIFVKALVVGTLISVFVLSIGLTYLIDRNLEEERSEWDED